MKYNENYELELDTLAEYWDKAYPWIVYAIIRVDLGYLIAIPTSANPILPDCVELVGYMEVGSNRAGSGEFTWVDKKLKRYLYDN